jgi:hypothetical protein
MPFDWNDFLTLADELATKLDEAPKRTAISRAYYCVFNLAFARAESTTGRRPRGAHRHQWCWDQYTKTPDRTCAQLGVTGDRMKRLRVDADYKAAKIPRLNEEVQRMLEDAHQFLADLAALNPQYPRP